MQVEKRSSKILIVGRSGSGKSTYQTRYVDAYSARASRIFIFDHKLEFQKRCNFPALFSLDAVSESLGRGDRVINYHYSQEYPGESEEAFQLWCQFVYDFCNTLEQESDGAAGNNLFVCDEVNRFTSSTDMGSAFKLLIEDGRLNGIDFIGTSHAANQISNRLRLQLSEIVALSTLDPRPLAFLEECGFDPDEVSALPAGSYVLKNLEKDIFVRGKLFSCAVREKEVVTPLDDSKPRTAARENSPQFTPQTPTGAARADNLKDPHGAIPLPDGQT